MTPTPNEESVLLIISAASGTGKSSLSRALVESSEGTVLSVSHTTREIRRNEIEGKDYYFVGDDEFQRMIEAGEFVEYAKVYDHYYGTSRTSIEQHLNSGENVLLEIEWQGARQVVELFPSAVRVFLLPPSIESLRKRLRSRGRDSGNTIEARLAAAVNDIKNCFDYDYLILNDQFDSALSDLKTLLPGSTGTIRPIPAGLLGELGIVSGEFDESVKSC